MTPHPHLPPYPNTQLQLLSATRSRAQTTYQTIEEPTNITARISPLYTHAITKGTYSQTITPPLPHSFALYTVYYTQLASQLYQLVIVMMSFFCTRTRRPAQTAPLRSAAEADHDQSRAIQLGGLIDHLPTYMQIQMWLCKWLLIQPTYTYLPATSSLPPRYLPTYLPTYSPTHLPTYTYQAHMSLHIQLSPHQSTLFPWSTD